MIQAPLSGFSPGISYRFDPYIHTSSSLLNILFYIIHLRPTYLHKRRTPRPRQERFPWCVCFNFAVTVSLMWQLPDPVVAELASALFFFHWFSVSYRSGRYVPVIGDTLCFSSRFVSIEYLESHLIWFRWHRQINLSCGRAVVRLNCLAGEINFVNFFVLQKCFCAKLFLPLSSKWGKATEQGFSKWRWMMYTSTVFFLYMFL